MRRSFIAILHAGLWLGYLFLIAFVAFAAFQGGSIAFDDPPYYIWFGIGVAIVPPVLSYYGHYHYLFPRYLQQRKIALSVIASLTISIISTLAGFAVICMTNAEACNCVRGDWPYALGFTLFLSIVLGVIALVIKGFLTWYQELKIKEELLEKTHRMELALIKSQLDPHFLFNTINNIDVLISKDPDEASRYLNKLSDMMRFMLYETRSEEVPLAQELAYISKYIELQKIRTANRNYINFTVTGFAGDKRVAPMLFIPFIENAFKHSGNKKLDQAVDIQLDIGEDQITFHCHNRFEPNGTPPNGQNGLGNALIKKRLELLYPDRHTLQIERAQDHYRVALTIHHGQV
ncbi:MAG: sensor histidine kinase [Saprospiraceae bacterium]|nr:sensor histidine kinase [Saprospiraceae bacterium]